MNTIDLVRQAFAQPLGQLVDHSADYVQLVRATQDPKFGDYQANFAMPLAKALKQKPRDVADHVVKTLGKVADFESVDVAGPGFINIRLSKPFIQWRLTEQWKSPHGGITPINSSKTVIVDYSSPNVAKPMHVGHLRSTVIGDAIARTYRALGWKVLSDNHLGDWGTQFGMLIYGWRNLRDQTLAEKSPIEELARLYKLVNRLGEDDSSLARACRDETAKLHEGDADNLALWNQFMPWCLADLAKIYDRLGIMFDMQLGESFYHPMLAEVVKSLEAKGLAQASDGAVCVFFPDPSGKVDDEGKPIPLLPPTIIKKSDGAFTYATSDLACIKYRVEHFKPTTMVYVVDDRQSLHFQQLFSAAKKWVMRRSNWCMSRSARSRAKMASPIRRAKEERSAWSPCSTKRSNGPVKWSTKTLLNSPKRNERRWRRLSALVPLNTPTSRRTVKATTSSTGTR